MIELLTPDEMALADRKTIAAGTLGIVLMERAGAAVADSAARLAGAGCGAVAVVCGPGNNGGDGFVAARLLAERGHQVRVALVGGRRNDLQCDAAEAAARWSGRLEPVDDVLGSAAVVVDALFGAGLSRDLDGEIRRVIEAINGAGGSILAVDLPSGVDGRTGVVRGAAIRARETVTFCRRKPGHLLLPGRACCGRVTVADIGIPDATVEDLHVRTFANERPLWEEAFPRLRIDGHKYERGHAVVTSGPAHATGAVRLAARAALRTGAGLVTVAAPKAAVPVLAASLTAVMVREANGARGLKRLLTDERLNTVLLGPGQGVGKATRAAVLEAAEAKRALVLDADALTSFADRLQVLREAVLCATSVILTPHEGEFRRLFSQASAVLRGSKLDRARAASALTGAVVVLKGGDTVVAAPDGRASIAANAPPWLATAGSGDVLAGILTGLIAQGMPPFEAACAGVWLHGAACHAAGPAMISEDLDAGLREILAELRAPPGTND